MVRIRDTTIVSINCTDPEQAARALAASCRRCRFERALLLTSHPLRFRRMDVRAIPEIRSVDDYSRFMIRDLFDFIHTDYCLVVQADGFVLNGDAWTDDFFSYDYIGAPWDLSFGPPYDVRLNKDNRVGNGGFSLRSRRLLYACKYLYAGDEYAPEDYVICRLHRNFFEAQGIRFAPPEVAARFSVENNLYCGQFGFHGRATMEANHIRL